MGFPGNSIDEVVLEEEEGNSNDDSDVDGDDTDDNDGEDEDEVDNNRTNGNKLSKVASTFGAICFLHQLFIFQ